MIPSVRGTRDILPGEVERWQRVEAVAREVCERFGYAEVRTPVLEREELFAKGTGASTDIVQKEMYSFTDKGGEQVTLRPEATPGLVRAYVQHGLEQQMVAVKLYNLGPMFRYERPQKGRYRQFHQLDVEVFGMVDPAIDAEVIDLAWTLTAALGVEQAELVVNSVGCAGCRPAFATALVEAIGTDLSRLCGDCQRRAETNPLRIFDCKVPADQPIIDELPRTVDFLCDECREHYVAVKRHLADYEIPFRESHRLVRGLDYYTRTTFELLGQGLGAQNALLGGGRYDGLVKQLGGPDRAGIGFAAGLERLVLALPDLPDGAAAERAPSAFVIAVGEAARAPALRLLREIRSAGCRAQMEYEARSLRAQMKRADRLGATATVMLGDDELARHDVTVRDMVSGDQWSVPRAEVVARVRALLAERLGES